MNLGSQAVVLVSTEDDLDGPRDAYGHPTVSTVTETPINGCRFRMVSSSETTETGNRVTEVWKLTAPPHPALMAATSRDEIRHDGTTYSITGSPRAVRDMDGSTHHVSVTCARYLG